MRTLRLSDTAHAALTRVLLEWDSTDRSETWACADDEQQACLLCQEDAVVALLLEEQTTVADAAMTARTEARLADWREMRDDEACVPHDPDPSLDPTPDVR